MSGGGLDECLAALRSLGREHGLDVLVHIRCDGRVQFAFEDLAGYVRHVVMADLEPGSAHPLPAAALNAKPIPRREPATPTPGQTPARKDQ